MTAVTISGSKARNVLARTEFDVYVSSWRAITDTIEVSLNQKDELVAQGRQHIFNSLGE